MDDISIEKIQISGPTLASLLHRFSSSAGDIHGLLFGHLYFSSPTSLSDDPSTTSAATTASNSGSPVSADSNLIAIITSFLSLPSHLPLPLDPPPSSLLGWFSGRRRTPLRPSLKDSTTTLTLSSTTSLASTPRNSPQSLSLPSSIFLLLTTPFQDQLIHTHEYKAYQYRLSSDCFEPKSVNIINIGPSFRKSYGSFSPNSPFPWLACELPSSNAMVEDERGGNSVNNTNNLKDQKALDACAEGFDIARLGKLMGSDAAKYTAELEDMYEKMLAKLDGLAKVVDKSSAKVLEQETQNMKLRRKVAGFE